MQGEIENSEKGCFVASLLAMTVQVISNQHQVTRTQHPVRMTLTDSDSKRDLAFYRKKLLLSMLIPFLFVFLMWLVKIVEILFGLDFSDFGIYPLSVRGLPGIILSPFLHADLSHLFNNSIPLLFLGTALFYFYSDTALEISFVIYILTGVLVWVAGRHAWHIGASGLVYGLASFLFFSGIIRRYFRLIALSLLVVFLYGSMVWGLFPGIYKNISWESHMLGFFSGILLAVWFRKEGPQEPVHEWLDEEEEEEDAQGTGQGAGSIEHRAQSTGHRAQSKESN